MFDLTRPRRRAIKLLGSAAALISVPLLIAALSGCAEVRQWPEWGNEAHRNAGEGSDGGQ